MKSIHLERGMGKTGFPHQGILPNTKFLQKIPEHWFKWNEVSEKGFNGWIFPGQGEAYPTCGTYHVKGCLVHNPGYFKRIKDNCERAQCPEDYRTWLVKSTKYIKKRIQEGKPGRYRKAIHVTVSPPRKEDHRFETTQDYRKMRRKAIRLAKKAGLIGGALIFHPYRENDKAEMWYFSPHFHILGYGWIVDTDKIYEKSGWIIKNHKVRKSIGATAYYQLSHAGIKSNHKVVSWFGELSWKALKVARDKAEPETCPMCGSPLRRVIYYGSGDNPMSDPNIEESYLDINYWRYR